LGSLLAFVVAATATRAADEPKAVVEGDLKKVQGEWVSKDDTGESTWSFKGNKLHIKTPNREYDITIKIDKDAKPNATIDLDVAKDSPNAPGTKAEGIYKFDGDSKVSICFGAGDAGRPQEFKTDLGTSFNFELTRKEK
jgi:uncharacterized protein (TIGR03067 family)